MTSILSLPVETLSQIIQEHTREPSDLTIRSINVGALKFSHISHRLRDACIASPAAWKSIEVLTPLNGASSPSTLSLVELYLQRSKNHPLELDLSVETEGDLTPDGALDPVMEALVKHASRWERLNIGLTWPVLRILHRKNLSFDALRQAELFQVFPFRGPETAGWKSGEMDLFASAPLLRHLTVESDVQFLEAMSFPLPQLLTVELRSGGNILPVLQTISQLSQVESLSLLLLVPRMQDPANEGIPERSPITLPHLRELTLQRWSLRDIPCLVMPHLILPVLEHLDLSCSAVDIPVLLTSLRIEMSTSSFHHLSYLCLRLALRNEADISAMLALLRHLPQLEEFRLIFRPNAAGPDASDRIRMEQFSIDTLLDALTCSTDELSPTQPICPNLTSLTLHGWALDPERYLRMIQSRRPSLPRTRRLDDAPRPEHNATTSTARESPSLVPRPLEALSLRLSADVKATAFFTTDQMALLQSLTFGITFELEDGGISFAKAMEMVRTSVMEVLTQLEAEPLLIEGEVDEDDD